MQMMMTLGGDISRSIDVIVRSFVSAVVRFALRPNDRTLGFLFRRLIKLFLHIGTTRLRLSKTLSHLANTTIASSTAGQ